MPNLISTTTPHSNAVQAMSLKVLQERQKAADEALAAATAPRQIISPWQGAAQMAQSFIAARQGAHAAQQEQVSRDELARLQSGIDPVKGPDMNTIAMIGRINPELGDKMLNDYITNQRTVAAREDEQAHQDTSATTLFGRQNQQAETKHGYDVSLQDDQQAAAAEAAKAKAEADAAAATTAFGRDMTKTKDQQTFEVRQAQSLAETQAAQKKMEIDAQAQAAKLIADAKLKEPNSPEAQLAHDYMNGGFGDPNSLKAKQAFAAAWATHTQLKGGGPTTSVSTSVDASGNPTTEVTTGESPSAPAPVSSATTAPVLSTGEPLPPPAPQKPVDSKKTQDLKAVTEDDIRQSSIGAAKLKDRIATMKEGVKNSGITGPWTPKLKPWLDFAEEGSKLAGYDLEKSDLWKSTAGTAAGRDITQSGTLGFVQEYIDNTKGAISDAEGKTFREATAGIDKRRVSNEAMLQLADALADRDMQRAKEWADFKGKGGDIDAFNLKWNDYINANPIIKDGPNGPEVGGKPLIGVGPTDSSAPAPSSDSGVDDLLKKYPG